MKRRFLQARFSLLAAAVCFFTPSMARAQATPVPDKKPDLSPMAMFMGTWTCKRLKSPNNRGVGVSFTSTTTMTMDDHWMVTDQTVPPYDQYRTRNNVSKSYTTYDPDTKQWVSIMVDNFGTYGMSTSPGWTGKTLVTKDTVNSGGAPLGVDTLTKISDTQYDDVYTVQGPKGAETYENTCTKS